MKILQHFSAIVIITIIMVLFYANVQQIHRSNANDPQTQLVYDLKEQLQRGRTLPESISDSVDLEKSLAVFIETYNEAGEPIQSNGYLNGKLPQLPKGLFEHARNNGEHWVTWQPKPNVRMAMGIARVNASPVAFVAVGRSLREVEQRESRLVKMIFTSWILCSSIVVINWFVHCLRYKKNKFSGL